MTLAEHMQNLVNAMMIFGTLCCILVTIFYFMIDDSDPNEQQKFHENDSKDFMASSRSARRAV